ncbi:hypothetical protein RintRC_3155 [Richelia intracellularis]|nr:hypothetical protein RintRC_3155 [Richelia intracellularis]
MSLCIGAKRLGNLYYFIIGLYLNYPKSLLQCLMNDIQQKW